MQGVRGLTDQDRRLLLYAGLLAAGSAAIATALVCLGEVPHSWWPVALLALISIVGEASRVRLTSSLEFSISLLPTLFAAVALGPLAALIVAGASMALEFRRDRMKWAVYTSSEAMTGAITGLVAAGAGQMFDGVLGSVVAATVCGALCAQILDTAFCAITVNLRGVARARDVVEELAPLIVASVPLYAPIVALLVVVYREVSEWTLPLFLIPTLAAQRLYALLQEQRELTSDLSAANARLEDANLSFATALVATLEARDQYTAGHSAAVARYAQLIAARMGLSAADQQLAHLCGLVHDIGKIGLPAWLLEKAGPLSLAERRLMETHAEIGERILAYVRDYREIARVVRHHHERVDGLGYPDGLRGEEIPLVSRIIAVADSYDAMTSDRPYREAMPSRVARLRLAQAVGSQFDVAVAAAFEAVLASTPDAGTGGRESAPVLALPLAGAFLTT